MGHGGVAEVWGRQYVLHRNVKKSCEEKEKKIQTVKRSFHFVSGKVKLLRDFLTG